MSRDDMLQFYIGFVRPVLEYAVAAWHTGLTTKLSDQLEITQKRALRIIYDGSSFNNCFYEQFCDKLCISSLSARRVASSTKFSNQSAACITLFPQEGIILKQQSWENPLFMIYHLHVQINSKTRLFCMHSIITSSSSHLSHLSHHSSHRCVSYCIVFNVCVSLYQFYAFLYACFNIQLHDWLLQNVLNECMCVSMDVNESHESLKQSSVASHSHWWDKVVAVCNV